MDTRRSIVYENSYGYTILQPQEGWREIDPDVWMQAVMKGLHDIFARCNPQEVSVIGVTGQKLCAMPSCGQIYERPVWLRNCVRNAHKGRKHAISLKYCHREVRQ